MKKITTIYALVIDPAKAIFPKPIAFTSPEEDQIKVWKECKMQIIFLNEKEREEVISTLNDVEPDNPRLRFVLSVAAIGWILFLMFMSLTNK